VRTLAQAVSDNKEVYDFLAGQSRPGTGSALEAGNPASFTRWFGELRVLPAGMMIGTDSHTPNAGGVGDDSASGWEEPTRRRDGGNARELKFPKVIALH